MISITGETGYTVGFKFCVRRVRCYDVSSGHRCGTLFESVEFNLSSSWRKLYIFKNSIEFSKIYNARSICLAKSRFDSRQIMRRYGFGMKLNASPLGPSSLHAVVVQVDERLANGIKRKDLEGYCLTHRRSKDFWLGGGGKPHITWNDAIIHFQN